MTAFSSRIKTFVTSRYLLFLILYFLLFTLIRVLAKPLAELDEAQEIYFSQWWSLGYGLQPPLYTWLQKIFFELFGFQIFPLGLLRAFWFFMILYFTFLIARRSFSQQWAVVASLLLLVCWPLSIRGWRATHTIAVTAMTVATLYYWLRILDKKHIRDFLFIGVCAGLGLLSKYNYALVLLSIITVTLIDKSSRTIFFSPKLFLSIGMAGLIVFPHGLWLIEHINEITEALTDKLDPVRPSYLVSVWQGLTNWMLMVLVYMASTVVFLLIFYRKQIRPGFLSKGLFSRDLGMLMGFLVMCQLFLLVMILSGQVSDFQIKWVFPFLVLFPLPLLALLIPVGKPAGRLLGWLVVIAFSILVYHGLRHHVERLLGMEGLYRIHCDFSKLVVDWPPNEGAAPVYLVQNYFMAGNIKFFQPAARVFCEEGMRMAPIPDRVLYLAPEGALDSLSTPGFEVSTFLYEDDCFELVQITRGGNQN